jgi:hypothetical protein
MKLKLSGTVHLIQPHCHGNGGWCGQNIIGTMPMKKALATCNLNWENRSSSGGDARVRICRTKDANDAILFFDAEESCWRDKKDNIVAQFEVGWKATVKRVKLPKPVRKPA